MSIFESNPKITVNFEHCFIEASLTLQVQASSYPLTVEPDQENTELMRKIFCEAISESIQRVSELVLQSHCEFEKAFHQAQGSVRLSQLKSSESTK